LLDNTNLSYLPGTSGKTKAEMREGAQHDMGGESVREYMRIYNRQISEKNAAVDKVKQERKDLMNIQETEWALVNVGYRVNFYTNNEDNKTFTPMYGEVKKVEKDSNGKAISLDIDAFKKFTEKRYDSIWGDMGKMDVWKSEGKIKTGITKKKYLIQIPMDDPVNVSLRRKEELRELYPGNPHPENEEIYWTRGSIGRWIRFASRSDLNTIQYGQIVGAFTRNKKIPGYEVELYKIVEQPRIGFPGMKEKVPVSLGQKIKIVSTEVKIMDFGLGMYGYN
jgi:hypothetical protein